MPGITSERSELDLERLRAELRALPCCAANESGEPRGIPPAPSTAPRTNLTEDPYFTDGLRLFMQLRGTATTPPEEVEFLDWNDSADPLGDMQVTGAEAEAPES
jgi:hypothetical protein